MYDLNACSTYGILGLARPTHSTRAYGLLTPTCDSNLRDKYYTQGKIRTFMVMANRISRRRSAACVALALYPAFSRYLCLLRRSPADTCACSGDHLRCSSVQRHLHLTGPLCALCAYVLSWTDLKRVVVALSFLLLRVLLVDWGPVSVAQRPTFIETLLRLGKDTR